MVVCAINFLSKNKILLLGKLIIIVWIDKQSFSVDFTAKIRNNTTVLFAVPRIGAKVRLSFLYSETIINANLQHDTNMKGVWIAQTCAEMPKFAGKPHKVMHALLLC